MQRLINARLVRAESPAALQDEDYLSFELVRNSSITFLTNAIDMESSAFAADIVAPLCAAGAQRRQCPLATGLIVARYRSPQNRAHPASVAEARFRNGPIPAVYSAALSRSKPHGI